MGEKMTIMHVGSGDEFSLLRQCAQRCVDNGGEWYSPVQAAAILGEHVGEPALLADAAFMGMATPECILRLLDRAEDHLTQPAQAVAAPTWLEGDRQAGGRGMKLKSELYETRDGGKDVYWNRESEVEHDAMAAHALLQAINETDEQDGNVSGQWGSCIEQIRHRAAEILAGWMGEE